MAGKRAVLKMLAAVAFFSMFVYFRNFEIRCALMLLAVFQIFSRREFYSRQVIFTALLGVFFLTFILPPLWVFLDQPLLRVLEILVIFVIGSLWAFFSSGDLKVEKWPRETLSLIVLTALTAWINYRPVWSDIPWKGDEDYHVFAIHKLFSLSLGVFKQASTHISNIPVVLLFIAYVALAFLFLRFSARYFSGLQRSLVGFFFVLIPILFYAVMQTNTIFDIEKLADDAMLYPYLSRWVQGLFIIGEQYKIALYRAVPFIAVIVFGWFLFFCLKKRTGSRVMSVAGAFAILTMPLVNFFSTLSYLDLTAVFFLSAAMVDIDALLNMEFKDLRVRSSWYFLITAGLIKETVLFFLVVFILVRGITRIKYANERGRVSFFIEESVMAFCVLAPVALFAVLSSFFWGRNSFYKLSLGLNHISCCFDPANYGLIFHTLLESYGMFLITMIGGIYLMFRKGRTAMGWANAIVFTGTIWFFLIFRPLEYTGYARWYLFTVPAVICATVYFITGMPGRTAKWGMLISLILSNAILFTYSPDGVRKNDWGCPAKPISECVYPFNEAVKWISEQGETKNVMVVGMYYYYNGMNYYFSKYFRKPRIAPKIKIVTYNIWGYGPEDERVLLDAFLKDFASKKEALAYDTLIYLSVNNIPIDPARFRDNGFRYDRVFRNSRNSLYVFRR